MVPNELFIIKVNREFPNALLAEKEKDITDHLGQRKGESIRYLVFNPAKKENLQNHSIKKYSKLKNNNKLTNQTKRIPNKSIYGPNIHFSILRII
jgi:hypothetical protein